MTGLPVFIDQGLGHLIHGLAFFFGAFEVFVEHISVGDGRIKSCLPIFDISGVRPCTPGEE